MLLPGTLKNFLRGSRTGDQLVPPAANGSARRAFPARRGELEDPVTTRPSRGLEEFFGNIRGQSGLHILDLGGATQQNVSFITNLGHRLCTEDFLRILGDVFGTEDTVDQSNPGRIDFFLRQSLDYPDDQFDGVLIWDVLEYLEPTLLNAVIERLRKIVRPRSYMLAVFHSDDKLLAAPFYTFRIQEVNTLQVTRQGVRRPAQLFNNRSLERLFGRFESVKFFLTRERLREVIVKV
jgi:2-polyprenyl-3-methyl-5-hydroxy-6-metoxy-1,4-benzoquinol methylase